MHVIRLRGPWEYESPSGDSPLRGKIQFPGAKWDALAPEVAQLRRVRLIRRFGAPTGIEPGDRVELVIESGGGAVEISLNGQRLSEMRPGASPFRHDIAALLAPRNELAINLSAAADSDGSVALLGEVRLEIM